MKVNENIASMNMKQVKQFRQTSRVLNDILCVSMYTQTLEECLNEILKILVKIPWLVFDERGAIFLIEPGGKELVLSVAHNFSEAHRELCRRVPIGECMCGKAAEAKKLIFSNHRDERHKCRCPDIPPHGHYCVPIVSGEELLGVLNLYVAEGHRRSTEEEIFLNSVATILANLIQIKRVQQTLDESEGVFRELTATTSAAIFIYQDKRFVYVNKACVEITGYSEDELLTMNFWDIVHPDYRELVRERGLARQRGEKVPTRYEFKIIRKDGQERWIDLMAGKIIWKGKPAGIGTAFDITDRKNMEQQLHEQLDFMRYVIDSFDYPFYVINADTYEIEKANQALLQGKKLSSGLTCYELTHNVSSPCASAGCPCPIDIVRQTKEPVVLEHIHYDAHGREQIVEVHAHPVFDKEGNVTSLIEFTIDITPRKRLEKALSSLAQSYAHLTGKDFLDAITTHIAKTMNLDIVYIGELISRKEQIHIISASKKHIEGMVYDLTYTPCENVVNKSLVVYLRDVQQNFPKDEILKEWGIQGYIGTPLFDPNRQPLGIMVGLSKKPIEDHKLLKEHFQIFVDRVTAELLRMKADRALQESEKRFRLLAESSLTGIYLIQEGKFTYVNKALAGIFGYEVDEIIGKLGPLDLTYPDDRELVKRNIQRRLSGEVESIRYDFRGLRKDGVVIFIEVHGRRIMYRGKPGIIGTLVDITERKLAEQEIERSHRLLLTLSQSAQEVQRVRSPEEIYRVIGDQIHQLGYDATIFVLDESQRYFTVEYTTLTVEELKICERNLNRPVIGYRIPIREGGFYHRILQSGETIFITTDASDESRNRITAEEQSGIYGLAAQLGWEHSIIAPLKTPDKFHGLLVVSGKGLTEAAMKVITTFANQAAIAVENARLYHETKSLALFNKQIVENVADGIIVQDKTGKITFVNPAGAKMLGFTSPGELVGKDWTYIVPSDQRAIVESADLRRKRGISDRYELELKRKDGEHITVLVSGSPIVDEHGNFTGTMAVFTDITELKRAEQERIKLQEQLFQVQKLEAIGRLAGGVAHDFNNMLTAIIGHAELGLNKTHPDNPVYSDLKEILDAAMRSADLTSKLLGFARKQTVLPKILDLNDTISGMLSMLQRLIGEDIEISWTPCRDLWKVRIDPTQVNQILANLIVNSKDAGAKTVIIETDNICVDAQHLEKHPHLVVGEYVLLAISDDGCGMDSTVMEHIFEPFFTTKEPGKGTGLGLATVYGIIKQNNGFIHVYSEPGKGTTFKIYLPRYTGKEESKRIPEEPRLTQGQGETILLVEDEKQILEVLRIMLEHLGYRVLPANRPSEALELAKSYMDEIDLLLTDVVMPEMNGMELAKRLITMNPSMKCIYMSGYTANHIANHGVLDKDVAFVTKPLNIKELAQKIREVLARDN